MIAFLTACLLIPKYSPASVKVEKSNVSLVLIFKSLTGLPSRSLVLALILASGDKGLFFL